MYNSIILSIYYQPWSWEAIMCAHSKQPTLLKLSSFQLRERNPQRGYHFSRRCRVRLIGIDMLWPCHSFSKMQRNKHWRGSSGSRGSWIVQISICRSKGPLRFTVVTWCLIRVSMLRKLQLFQSSFPARQNPVLMYSIGINCPATASTAFSTFDKLHVARCKFATEFRIFLISRVTLGIAIDCVIGNMSSCWIVWYH